MKYDFKNACMYAKSATTDELFKRSIVYNAYAGFNKAEGAATVGHDVMLSMMGAIYGPLGKTDEQTKKEIMIYLERINYGFNNWATDSARYFSINFKSKEDAYYFNEMITILMKKSDDVYYLLSRNTHIERNELLRDLIYPFSVLDNSNGIPSWMYI